jgi:hypothetical protein
MIGVKVRAPDLPAYAAAWPPACAGMTPVQRPRSPFAGECLPGLLPLLLDCFASCPSNWTTISAFHPNRPFGAKEPKVRPGDGKCQLACKPGSVPAARAAAMAIHLGRLLPDASSNQPGRRCGNAFRSGETPPLCRPYSVLLPAGFAVPALLPAPRCALTAPFHPYSLKGLIPNAFRHRGAQSAR